MRMRSSTLSRKSERIEGLSVVRPSGRGGRAAPTFIVALAVVLVVLLIVANLLLERSAITPVALTSSVDLLGSVDEISAALRHEREPDKAVVEEPVKEAAQPIMVEVSAKEESVDPTVAPLGEAKEETANESARVAGQQLGCSAVRAGLFRSQRYLIALEREIDAVNVSHFRDKIVRPGKGFKLTIEGGDVARAKDILEEHGYEVEAANGSAVAYYFVDKEAEKALSLLEKQGIKGAGVAPFSGDLPVWKLSCGPYSKKAEADTVAALLRKKKIVDAVVTKNE